MDPLPLLVLVPGGSLVQWIALEALVGAAAAAAAKHCFLSGHVMVGKLVGWMPRDTFDFLFLWFLFLQLTSTVLFFIHTDYFILPLSWYSSILLNSSARKIPFSMPVRGSFTNLKSKPFHYSPDPINLYSFCFGSVCSS